MQLSREQSFEKVRSKIFVNGKNKVSVCTGNEFKGHFWRTINAIFITVDRAKYRMVAEGYKLKFTAVGTVVHGTIVRRIPAVNHLQNVFHNNGTGMKNIVNFFVVFFENLLKDVYKSIVKELRTENTPSRLRGRGVE